MQRTPWDTNPKAIGTGLVGTCNCVCNACCICTWYFICNWCCHSCKMWYGWQSGSSMCCCVEEKKKETNFNLFLHQEKKKEEDKMNEQENYIKGYDIALKYIHPKLIGQEFCLSKNKKTEDQRIEELFALTKTKPMYFKQGVKQCVQEWWHMTERVETMRKLPPIIDSSLVCTELFIPSEGFMSCACNFSVVDKNKHMDMHFRVNQLLTRILEPETSVNTSTSHTQPQKMSTKTRIALLRMLEEPDLKNATRLRITKQLADAHVVGFFHPNQKPTSQPKKKITVARGWFAAPKIWTRATLKDVPMDVIRFGKLQLSNGDGLWRDTFPATTEIPAHWQPWLLPMKSSSSSYYIEKKQQQHSYGSKMYMQSLTVEQRTKDFIHTEDKYDDRLCAICGEPFEVVLSGDPQDTLEEDFVLLHAIVDSVSRHFIHKHCSSSSSSAIPPPPVTKKATKKKPRQFFLVTSDSD